MAKKQMARRFLLWLAEGMERFPDDRGGAWECGQEQFNRKMRCSEG